MQSVQIQSHSILPACSNFGALANLEQDQIAEREALLIGYLTLCNLADDNRWLTLIVAKNVDLHNYRKSLSRFQRLRVIQVEEVDMLWISWRCLAQGNSQAVIALVNTIDDNARQHLQQAAQLGCSTLHLVKAGE